jgi:DNA-binding PadR family transcriptional regulator
MARLRKEEFSAGMAILGLVIQRPDTVNGVKVRLAERFPTTRWSPSVPYEAMGSLAERGYVRMAAGGAARSLDLYEATPKGVAWFRKWFDDRLEEPPALRDALRGKLEYVADENDLQVVMEAIREQEEACFEVSHVADARLDRARRRGELGSAKSRDWRSRLLYGVMTYDVNLWSDRGLLLKRLREALEDPDELFEESGPEVS